MDSLLTHQRLFGAEHAARRSFGAVFIAERFTFHALGTSAYLRLHFESGQLSCNDDGSRMEVNVRLTRWKKYEFLLGSLVK